MRKGKIHKIILITIASFAVSLTGSKIFAQTRYLEFKCGAVGSSPFNNSAPAKDFDDIRPGITVGAIFGHEFKNKFIRVYGELYYTGKGEKYSMDNNQGDFNSFVNYCQFCPNIRFYLPQHTLYLGIGGYAGYAANRKVTSGDLLDQSHYIAPIEYYTKYDLGPRCAIGTELGVGNIKLTAEIAYEYGLANVSRRSEREITNQSVLATLGISFKMLGRRYRHY